MADYRASGISGVNSAINPLAANPGSLLHLTNMISDVSGWAIKRHGIKQLNATSSYTSVFSGLNASSTFPVYSWLFDDHLFVYVEDSASGGSGIAAYSMVQTGQWQKVVESTGVLRVDSSQYKPKACTADRRMLLNTASGVKRIAAIYAANYPKDSGNTVAYSTLYRDAGVPRALDPRCRSAVAGGATDHGLFSLTRFEWLLLSSAVAYRVAWFKRDENGIAGIGAPSGRVVIRNTSTTTNYATRLKIVIPSGVTDSSYVMQIYRTNIIQMDGAGVIPDPGDDMFLAGEYRLTSTDLSNGYVLYEDVSFDPLLGADLYTNELQEGILAARTTPPLCRDIASFGGCTFFSNTTEKQRVLIKVLAVDQTGIGTDKGITVGDKIVMGDLVMEGVLLANEEVNDWYFAVDATTGAGSEVLRALKTTESLCYKYNVWSNKKNGRYQAFNVTTNDDVFGVIQLEEKSVGGSTGAYIGVNRVDAPVQILPAPVFTSTPSNTLAQACQVVTNAGPTLVTVTTAAAHNLTTNDLVFLAPFGTSTSSGTSSPKLTNTQVPSGVYKATVTGATTFTFPSPTGAASAQTDARAATTGGYVHKIFDSTSSVWTEARSDNSRRVNRLMWSSPGEPETAPIVNSADIGAADKAILRIVPTQDSMFIFKEDGAWRLKGDSGDWEIIVLDSSCVLAAYETPGVVDGRVFCYSTNGVVSIDDGGVSKISTNVGGIIDNYYRSIATDPATASSYFGTGHGEDQAYWITFGTQADTWRYHCPTRTWSNHYWISPNGNVGLSSMITAKCSRYTTFDNQAYSERLVIMYIGDTSIGVERKTGKVNELCDFDIPVTVSSFDSTAHTVTLASVPIVASPGDVFVWYDNSNYVPGGYGGNSSAKHRGIISAINGNVITITNTDSMAAWPAVSGSQSGSILSQIKGRVVFTPISVGGGFSTGHFSEVDFSIGSRGLFSSMTAGFSTDVSFPADITTSDSYTSTVNGYLSTPTSSFFKNRYPGVMPGLLSFRTGVPRQASMASSIIISLNHNRAFEQFDVAGIRLITQEGDNRTRRTNA